MLKETGFNDLTTEFSTSPLYPDIKSPRCVTGGTPAPPRRRDSDPSGPYSWSRVIQQAARKAVSGFPQPTVNNSAREPISSVNSFSFASRLPNQSTRGDRVTNSVPQPTRLFGRLSHPAASPRPKTNPQMTNSNSHPIRTSRVLGPRVTALNPIVRRPQP